jgi:hypothetical protein
LRQIKTILPIKARYQLGIKAANNPESLSSPENGIPCNDL